MICYTLLCKVKTFSVTGDNREKQQAKFSNFSSDYKLVTDYVIKRQISFTVFTQINTAHQNKAQLDVK